MLGAIIGDIIGSRWEFNPVPGNDYNFQLFSDKNSYTDDKVCTIAIADAILHGSDEYGSYIHKWCRNYPQPMGGYGGRFAQWINSNNPQPYNSYGNGSAMRVSPIGWYFENLDQALAEAKKSAACTHNHPEGIKGAQAVVLAINNCLNLRKTVNPSDINQSVILTQGLQKALALYYPNPLIYDLDLTQYVNRFDETCQGTVPIALWIVQHSHNFEDAVRLAVSMGADADTVGAITGSIAEALWGIPEWIIQKALCYLPDAMKNVLNDFHTLTLNQQTIKKKSLEATQNAEQAKAMMYWKLGINNTDKEHQQEDPMPQKHAAPTQEMINELCDPMPDTNISSIKLCIPITAADLDTLKQGHVPESMEDHWFMYTDNEHINYHRSWSGMCAFVAHYQAEGDHFVIDNLVINHALSEFGVNGDKTAIQLFRYLLTAEIGTHLNQAWQQYLDAWEGH